MTAQVTDQPNGFVNTLADILVSQGVLNQEEAQSIKLAEIQTGKNQEDLIAEQNYVSEIDLTKAKAQFYNVEFVDLNKVPVSPEALAKLPQQVAQRLRAFPVKIDMESQTIHLAMADPLDLASIEFVEQKTGMKIKAFAAVPSEVDRLIQASYSTTLAREVSEALREAGSESTVRVVDPLKSGGVIRDEKVGEIVNHILSFASKSRASDVHIEPQESTTRVRYRIDGILQERLTTPKELHDAIVSRIKILSGMKIDEKRVPQDGRFNFKVELEDIDLRVSSLPTSLGEKIVMRLLKKTGGIPDLPDLGLRGRALKNLYDSILRPHGIILICGPTGSGKTTTLYSIIQRINTPQINIMTLEDPIEYKIQGVNQVQINPDAGLTFASGLRSFLRQDPNVILVGEIRDQETADLAIQAALTGHLVFSTLHTNDASEALPRLLDMGAEPYLLSSTITAIVAQRVVRKIHEDCKAPYPVEQNIVSEFENVLGPIWQGLLKKNPQLASGQMSLYKGQGDKNCGNSGYFGRLGIFEVLPVSEKISRLILEHSSAMDIEKVAREEGMLTLKQDGYLKAIEGLTSMEEVLRVAQE